MKAFRRWEGSRGGEPLRRRVGGAPATLLFSLFLAAVFPARLAARTPPEDGGGQAEDAGRPGLKSRLAEGGIVPDLTYFGEVFGSVSGGLKPGAVYIGNLSLTLALDLDRLAGWRGGSLFFYGMNLQDGDPEAYFGDLQGVSSIAAPGTTKLYEAWLEQGFLDGRLTLLAGLYDLNSEFDVLESASVFMNPSQGIDPTFALSGLNGPSVFPYTTLGFRAGFKSAGFYVRSAVLNGLAGNPDHPGGTRVVIRKGTGFLAVLETGYHFPIVPGRHVKPPKRRRVRRYVQPTYAGKIALGLWGYTSRFAPVFPGPEPSPDIRGDRGLYGLVSHTVWRDGDIPGRNVMAFARVGLANPRINRLGLFTGGGLVLTGLVPGRSLDIAGLAFAAAFNGDEYMRKAVAEGSPVRRAEWNFELTYQAAILSWLGLHPDLQFIVHPGTDPGLRNAFGFDLRVEISL